MINKYIDPVIFHGNHLTELTDAIHQFNKDNGWWTDPKTGEDLRADEGTIAKKILLIHSEISEGVEGWRKGLMDGKLPNRPMLEVELADALIRIFDLAGVLGLDIAGALIEKFAYNVSREDHKLENRAGVGGKKF